MARIRIVLPYQPLYANDSVEAQAQRQAQADHINRTTDRTIGFMTIPDTLTCTCGSTESVRMVRPRHRSTVGTFKDPEPWCAACCGKNRGMFKLCGNQVEAEKNYRAKAVN